MQLIVPLRKEILVHYMKETYGQFALNYIIKIKVPKQEKIVRDATEELLLTKVIKSKKQVIFLGLNRLEDSRLIT